MHGYWCIYIFVAAWMQLQCLLAKDPAARITLDDVLAHPWMADAGVDQVAAAAAAASGAGSEAPGETKQIEVSEAEVTVPIGGRREVLYLPCVYLGVCFCVSVYVCV